MPLGGYNMDYTPKTLREAAFYIGGQQTQHHYKALWERRGQRLIAMAVELERVTSDRDMLARRCAEQAAEIARLLAPADTPKATIHDAIAKMQAAGIR